MDKPLRNRWFHALVVTGASLTACGGQTDDTAGDASSDTPSTDGAPGDAADGGNPIIIIPDAGSSPPNDASSPDDARNDPRCCTITR
jgi:hypothetical protein